MLIFLLNSKACVTDNKTLCWKTFWAKRSLPVMFCLDQRLGHGGQQEGHHGGRRIQKSIEGIPFEYLQLLFHSPGGMEPYRNYGQFAG